MTSRRLMVSKYIPPTTPLTKISFALFYFSTMCELSVPGGENREFCQSCLLTGEKEEPVVLSRAVERDEEMSLNTGGVIDIVSVFYHYGGSKWYINDSYACSNTWVRVIYASFDPPLEIVSVREIFKNVYP